MIGLLSGLPAGRAAAHGGGLDAQGCHTNRKTGDRHCHRGPGAAAAGADGANLKTAVERNGRAYRNCSEARDAGAAPVKRSDPGYGSHLDRDNDGIGCE